MANYQYYILTDGEDIFDSDLMTEEEAAVRNASSNDATDGNVTWQPAAFEEGDADYWAAVYNSPW